MTTKDDGGPAFPSDMIVGHSVTASKPYSGMSLRDWFAGQALAGAIEDYDRVTRRGPGKDNCLPYSNAVLGSRETIIAMQAYNYADAMLAARKGGAE